MSTPLEPTGGLDLETMGNAAVSTPAAVIHSLFSSGRHADSGGIAHSIDFRLKAETPGLGTSRRRADPGRRHTAWRLTARRPRAVCGN